MRGKKGWILLFGLTWLAILSRACSAIDKTPTGFYYPTGTRNLGNLVGFLTTPPEYFEGLYHLGKDIKAKTGDSVYAISDGEIVRISRDESGWGKGNVALIIRHRLENGENFFAVYGHIRTDLNEGQKVKGAQVIGLIGPYGHGAHLHFGIYPKSKAPTAPLGRWHLPKGWKPGDPLDPKGFVDPIEWIEEKRPYRERIPLRVLHTYPENGAKNISPNIEPAIRFNQPLDPTTVQEAISISLPGTTGEYFPYEIPGIGPPKLVLVEPDKVKYTDFYFYPGTTFTIKVSQRLKSQSGVPLEKPFEFSFTIASEALPYNDWSPQPISSGDWREYFIGAGKEIVFLSDRGGNTALYTADLEGTEVKRMISFSGFVEGFNVSPSGNRLLLLSKTGSIHLLDVQSGKVFDLKLTCSLDFFPGWAGDDSFYFEDREKGVVKARIVLVGFFGKGEELEKDWIEIGEEKSYLGGKLKVVAKIRLEEPDKRLTFLATMEDGKGFEQICIIDQNQRVNKWLTEGEFNNTSPCLGQASALMPFGGSGLLVFASDRDGNWEIYTMSQDGQARKRLTDNQAKDTQPAWAFYTKKILFVSDRTGKKRIWMMDRDGSNQRTLTFK